MSAQLDLFGTPAPAKATRHHRPVLRRVDLEGAKTVRTNYGTFELVQVNSDQTVTIRDTPAHVPHVVPFAHIEGIER